MSIASVDVTRPSMGYHVDIVQTANVTAYKLIALRSKLLAFQRAD